MIGTTGNIANDTMKTNICTTLSNSYEMTIQILEQGIPAATAQQHMDVIRNYTE